MMQTTKDEPETLSPAEWNSPYDLLLITIFLELIDAWLKEIFGA